MGFVCLHGLVGCDWLLSIHCSCIGRTKWQKINWFLVKNDFGENLILCSENPMTGYIRDGCCKTDESDLGTHKVCAIVSDEFLEFSLSQGNDLITTLPEYRFPGLIVWDKWCLCVTRWTEAYYAGVAPNIILEATHEKTLNYFPLEELVKFGR